MAYNFNPLKTKLKEVSEWLAREFSAIRTGRATPVLLDSVMVETYGTKMPLRQVGSISIEDPRTLRITLWDKSQAKAVESALQAANLGVSISSDGAGTRVIFPELTADKRKLLSRLAQEKVEQARIAVRREREEVWSDIQEKERAAEIREDEKFKLKEELQKIIDGANQELEVAGQRKEGEINS